MTIKYFCKHIKYYIKINDKWIKSKFKNKILLSAFLTKIIYKINLIYNLKFLIINTKY